MELPLKFNQSDKLILLIVKLLEILRVKITKKNLF